MSLQIVDGVRAQLWLVVADEKSVIQLAAKGYTIEQIAEQMCKAVDTVKQCRRRLFAKLGVDNIAEAVVFAINNKLLLS